jgi:heat-inducible transcriptional repressor
MDGHLNEREELILRAVVHTYVTTAEPVGSRAIVKRYGLDLSPATIRNAMADLEEAGFLRQLHTSSGRVPTDRGYRYYVNYLMRVQELTLGERERIERDLQERLNGVDELMQQTSHLLALVTHQAGIVEAPHGSTAEVRRIEVMPLAPSRAAVLVADSLGRVHTHVVPLEDAPSLEDLAQTVRFLNEELSGVTLDNLPGALRSRLQAMMDEQRKVAERAVRLLEHFPPQRAGQLFLEGAAQLFEQPEFRDVAKAREVFGLFEEHDRLAELLRAAVAQGEALRPSVVIGSEAEDHGLSEISVVASPYSVGGKTLGTLGVLGPRRMPYSRLTAVVDYTAGMLSRVLARLVG